MYPEEWNLFRANSCDTHRKKRIFSPKEWRRSVMKFYLPCGGDEKLLKNVINFVAQREGIGASRWCCAVRRDSLFISAESNYARTSWLNVSIVPVSYKLLLNNSTGMERGWESWTSECKCGSWMAKLRIFTQNTNVFSVAKNECNKKVEFTEKYALHHFDRSVSSCDKLLILYFLYCE